MRRGIAPTVNSLACSKQEDIDPVWTADWTSREELRASWSGSCLWLTRILVLCNGAVTVAGSLPTCMSQLLAALQVGRVKPPGERGGGKEASESGASTQYRGRLA